MFSKIRKGKGKDDEEDVPVEWDPVTTEATKQQPQGESPNPKPRGAKEASVILTGTKQVNVIVKGNKESPLAVPKVPRSDAGGAKPDVTEPRETDPLTRSTNGTESGSDKQPTVEIDLNEGDGLQDVPPSHPNWRQSLAKKLRPKSMGKQLKNPTGGSGGGNGGGMGPPHPSQPPSKKGYKLPGFFDFTPPPQTLRLEYKFDEWTTDNLNPEYQDPPKALSPVSYKVQSVSHKYWGEAFAAIQPVADFVIALVLELVSFAARITGRLVTGTLLRLTDLLLKPLWVFTFNALILPPFVLLANVLRVVSQSTLPLFEILTRAAEVAAIPLRALRLVEIRYVNYPQNPPTVATYTETRPPIVEEV